LGLHCKPVQDLHFKTKYKEFGKTNTVILSSKVCYTFSTVMRLKTPVSRTYLPSLIPQRQLA